MAITRLFKLLSSIGENRFDKTDYDSGDVSASFNHLLRPWEYIITPDFFGYWRRHVAWAKSNGKEVKEYFGQRYATSMVFMCLLLNAELAIVFNPSQTCTHIRHHLINGDYKSFEFYVGVTVIMAVFCTLFALLSIFIVWGMVSSLSDCNCLCVIRSSIGQYATQLPSRFILSSLLLFLAFTTLFQFILLPVPVAVVICGSCVSLYLHIVRIYSVFGRILMHSGVMNDEAILDATEESSFKPDELHERLGERAVDRVKRRTSVTVQYRKSSSDITDGRGSVPTLGKLLEPEENNEEEDSDENECYKNGHRGSKSDRKRSDPRGSGIVVPVKRAEGSSVGQLINPNYGPPLLTTPKPEEDRRRLLLQEDKRKASDQFDNMLGLKAFASVRDLKCTEGEDRHGRSSETHGRWKRLVPLVLKQQKTIFHTSGKEGQKTTKEDLKLKATKGQETYSFPPVDEEHGVKKTNGQTNSCLASMQDTSRLEPQNICSKVPRLLNEDNLDSPSTRKVFRTPDDPMKREDAARIQVPTKSRMEGRMYQQNASNDTPVTHFSHKKAETLRGSKTEREYLLPKTCGRTCTAEDRSPVGSTTSYQ